ncbi:MAG: polysaccharide pyruvyl transferase family protein [Desulfitobacteriaceae bacterium]
MKIGTITFHWATNYGAVLQAYALQQYLKQNQYETEIIDYIPFRVKIIQTIMHIKNLKISEFIKEYKINKFRERFLNLSEKKFYTNSNLIKDCHSYDCYICGSDQVWNEYFTLFAEGKLTLSYYLNFVKKGKTRISYATSFGTDKLSQKVIDLVKPELEKFKSISVREITGKAIIENIGLQAILVVDPTLLIDKETYEKLFEDRKINDAYQLFAYILHQNQTTAHAITDYIYDKYFDAEKDKRYGQDPIGIIEWLYGIKNAKFVVTNSFHGAIFSIIFHTPFIVVAVEGSGMNNRITTLLDTVGLNERIIGTLDNTIIDSLITESIDWNQVDERVRSSRKVSSDFLRRALDANSEMVILKQVPGA